MGRGGALWNDRVFSKVFVDTWRSVEGVGEPSYGEEWDRYAGEMETNQKLNVLRIG